LSFWIKRNQKLEKEESVPFWLIRRAGLGGIGENAPALPHKSLRGEALCQNKNGSELQARRKGFSKKGGAPPRDFSLHQKGKERLNR